MSARGIELKTKEDYEAAAHAFYVELVATRASCDRLAEALRAISDDFVDYDANMAQGLLRRDLIIKARAALRDMDGAK